MTEPLEIRVATIDDADGLAALFAEDWAFYGLDVPSGDELARHIQVDVLGSDAGAVVLMAFQDGEAVGFSISAVLYPAPDATGQMYMKELFVSERSRGGGVGKRLMVATARYAVEHGCSRLDWTAETTNQPAIDYYRHLGATHLEEKLYFRLDREALRTFADDT